MHNVEAAEATEDFAKCWQASVQHIQTQAQGSIESWLRGHLRPPFLEHLSFRLGNQLFYIRLQDVDDHLDMPGSFNGLFDIANATQGHACLMPMRLDKGVWSTTEPGWGLVDAVTGSQVNPPALISDENIVMSDWELQDLAVQVVCSQIKKDGKELMSWSGDKRINPSLWFVGDDGPEWVVVRAVRYPEKDALPPDNIKEIQKHMEKQGFHGHFASVAIANADDPFDPIAKENGNFLPLYRGHKMFISYEGLSQIKGIH